MAKTGSGLVVAGNRSAAIERACRNYQQVLQLSAKTAAAVAAPNLTRVDVPGDDAEAIAALTRTVTTRIQPAAVVALSEPTVMLCARLRESLGLEGLSVDSAQACTDKLTMKQRVQAAGLPCANFLSGDHATGPVDLGSELGLPFVVKTRTGSGGRAMRVVRAGDPQPASLEPGYMAESFVDGVEMSVESFVVGSRPIFVNFTEYTERGWSNMVPASPAGLPVDELLALNGAVIEALQINRGMTHMEVFLTSDGPVFGEIAARPPGGRIMDLLELAYGFDPWHALFEIERGASPELPARPKQVAGSRFVHPGPGTVVAVNGREQVERQPALVQFRLSARPGKTIGPRLGTGQSVGYALFAGEREQVEAGIASVGRELSIVVG